METLTINKSGTYYLNRPSNIIVKDNIRVTLYLLIKGSSENILIDIGNNSELIIKEYLLNSSLSKEINLKENSKLNSYNALLNKTNNEINITTNNLASNSKVDMTYHFLNLKGELSLNIINKYNDKLKNIDTYQNSIIYNLGGISNIKPIIMPNSKNIKAEHSSFISNLPEEEIFMLMSRGIDRKEAEKLLIHSFLLNRENDQKVLDFIKENYDV